LTSPHQSSPLSVRAIDVGYQNTKFTLGRKAVGEAERVAADLFPTLAPIVTTQLQADGHIAERDDGVRVRVEDCEFFVGKDVLNHLGGRETRSLAVDFSRGPKYMACVLGALHYIVADSGGGAPIEISHLTVGLPLNTYADYRAPLRERLEGSHSLGQHRVVIRKVHVLPQPQGALLYHAAKSSSPMDGWTLVIDVGGGTLDWYLASKQRPNFQRSGAHPKGMLACAQAVVDSMKVPEWRDNHEVIARIDRAIRDGSQSFRAERAEHPLAPHSATVEAVMDEAATRMFDRLGSTADIDHIILTGGGAKAFRRFLVKKRPQLETVLQVDPDPVFCNVLGFHLFGELMHEREKSS